MEKYIDRLTDAGMLYACACEIVNEYLEQNDIDGLNGYINLIENGYTACGGGGGKNV